MQSAAVPAATQPAQHQDGMRTDMVGATAMHLPAHLLHATNYHTCTAAGRSVKQRQLPRLLQCAQQHPAVTLHVVLLSAAGFGFAQTNHAPNRPDAKPDLLPWLSNAIILTPCTNPASPSLLCPSCCHRPCMPRPQSNTR